jgi:hypothetical protein
MQLDDVLHLCLETYNDSSVLNSFAYCRCKVAAVCRILMTGYAFHIVFSLLCVIDHCNSFEIIHTHMCGLYDFRATGIAEDLIPVSRTTAK